MFFKQTSSKGLVITITVILEALFAIGASALLYWIFLNRIVEIHVAVNEGTNERHAINLANVLISSEKIAYEKEGKVMRGILDVNKLDDIFAKSSGLTFVPFRDIGIGYPNSLNVVRVVDLENCDSSDVCEGWIVFLSGPVTLQGLAVTDFASCLSEHVKLEIGSIFRGVVGGLPLALWQPLDLQNCVQNNIPSSYKSFFSSSEISSKGLPVVLEYPDGDLHIGKITVAVGEFV